MRCARYLEQEEQEERREQAHSISPLSHYSSSRLPKPRTLMHESQNNNDIIIIVAQEYIDADSSTPGLPAHSTSSIPFHNSESRAYLDCLQRLLDVSRVDRIIHWSQAALQSGSGSRCRRLGLGFGLGRHCSSAAAIHRGGCSIGCSIQRTSSPSSKAKSMRRREEKKKGVCCLLSASTHRGHGLSAARPD